MFQWNNRTGDNVVLYIDQEQKRKTRDLSEAYNSTQSKNPPIDFEGALPMIIATTTPPTPIPPMCACTQLIPTHIQHTKSKTALIADSVAAG